MGIPRLRQSVCGCTLETGSMILAWLGVIATGVEILFGICFFTVFYSAIEDKVKEQNPADFENIMLGVKVVMVIVFLLVAVAFVFNLLLLIGIYKRNHCLMMPWIIGNGIATVVSIVLSVLSTLISMTQSFDMFLSALLSDLMTAFGVYLYLLVYSFYTEVKEERKVNDQRFQALNA